AGILTAEGIAAAHADHALVENQTDFTKLPLWEQLSGAAEGTLPLYTDYQNLERMGAFATVPELGWKVWVGHTKSEVEEELQDTYLDSLPWVLVAVGLGLLASLAMVRAIARPIDALRLT